MGQITKTTAQINTLLDTVNTLSKTSVGLGNVDNTSDVNKPISTATQNALNAKADSSAVSSALSAKLDTASLPPAATDLEITTGTATSTRTISPAQAKLAAQTFGISKTMFASLAAFTTAGGPAAYGTGPVWIAGQQYWCDGSAITLVAQQFNSDNRLKKVAPLQTLGTLACDQIGTNTEFSPAASPKALLIAGKKTKQTDAAPIAAIDANSGYIKLTGLGTDTIVQATTLFSINGTLTPILDRSIANIGFFCRAMPRADGEPYSSIYLRVGIKNAASNGFDFAQTYYDWRMSVKCDGVERFYTINPAEAGATNAPADGFGNFDHGHSLGGIMFRLPTTVDSCKKNRNAANPTYFGANDSVYFGKVYYNCKGLSKGIVRYDDNINGTYVGTYKSITNPSRVTDFIPNLTSSSFPDSNARCFANDSYGTGYAFKGKSGITIANNSDISLAEIIKLFGFTATTFILCRHVGTTNFLSVNQLRTLSDNYGWLVAFQTYYNPVSNFQQGVQLLGPQGYNLIGTKWTSNGASATPTVSAVETNTSTPTLRLTNVGVGQAGGGVGQEAFTQGYPVIFNASSLPSALTAGTVYWLRVVSQSNPDANTTTQNVSVHATELDAHNGTNAIDIVTGYSGIATNIVFRYRNSTPDYTGILAEFNLGKQWFLNNGFGDGYKTWAANQGGIDKYVEQAIEAFGEFKYLYRASNSASYLDIPFASTATQYYTVQYSYSIPDREFISDPKIISTSLISTDNLSVTQSCSVTAATDIVALTGTIPADVYVQNDETVYFTALTGGSGLTASIGNVYFVINTTGTTFQLALTKGGAAINIASDGTGTVQLSETYIRQRVRNAVYNGALVQNITHDTSGVLSTRQLVWYLDECKYWVNQGMLIMGNADKIGEMVLAERI